MFLKRLLCMVMCWAIVLPLPGSTGNLRKRISAKPTFLINTRKKGHDMEEEKQKRKAGRGRPPIPEELRQISTAVRLNKRDLKALDEYCRRKGWTHSEAIRKFIDLIR